MSSIVNDRPTYLDDLGGVASRLVMGMIVCVHIYIYIWPLGVIIRAKFP